MRHRTKTHLLTQEKVEKSFMRAVMSRDVMKCVGRYCK
jgi:hypothetical protein